MASGFLLVSVPALPVGRRCCCRGRLLILSPYICSKRETDHPLFTRVYTVAGCATWLPTSLNVCKRPSICRSVVLGLYPTICSIGRASLLCHECNNSSFGTIGATSRDFQDFAYLQLAMYACIRETASRFFAGVSVWENHPPPFRDRPPPTIRGESQTTKRELRFQAILDNQDTRLSLTLVRNLAYPHDIPDCASVHRAFR
jgi:hypothetical protein